MKIIKHGDPQLPEKWWVGQTAICDICHAEAVLDETDKVRRYSGTMRMNCFTPNCQGALAVTIDQARQSIAPPP